MVSDLPLEIASGILIAALLLFSACFVIALARRGQVVPALFLAMPICLIGGGLILAGLGFVPF